MAYGLAGIGNAVGGFTQGYRQAREQSFAMRMQQAQELGRQADEAIKTWQTLPEGTVKDLAWKAHADLLDQQQKVMGDKGPGAWNTVKHVFGMLPGLNKISPAESDTPGGGQVKQSDVAMPSSAPGAPSQTPALPEVSGMPGGPLAASRAGVVPDVVTNDMAPRPSSFAPPPTEPTAEGTPAGSTYSVPIQRVPQQTQQATDTQPNYGQQSLSVYQRMGMNPPKAADWGRLSQAITEGGSTWAGLEQNGDARKHLTAALADAYRAGNGPQASEFMRTMMPDYGKEKMLTSPESPAGQYFHLKTATLLPYEAVIEATKANEPRAKLLNDEASLTSQILTFKKNGQAVPQGLSDQFRAMTDILHPPTNRLEYQLRGLTDPNEIAKVLSDNDDERRQMAYQIAEARAEANAAWRNPQQPLIKEFNGVAWQVHPNGSLTALKDPATGKPMYTRPNASTWLEPSKQHLGGWQFNEGALDRDYESDSFGTRSELQRIAASGQFRPEIPASDAFKNPVPNPAYQALMLWFAKKGIDPKEVGFSTKQNPSGSLGGGTSFTPPPAPNWSH